MQDAIEVIKAAIIADDAVLLEGVHGLGKSEAPKELAKEIGYHYEPLYLENN